MVFILLGARKVPHSLRVETVTSHKFDLYRGTGTILLGSSGKVSISNIQIASRVGMGKGCGVSVLIDNRSSQPPGVTQIALLL